jgi:hypothetical protein
MAIDMSPVASTSLAMYAYQPAHRVSAKLSEGSAAPTRATSAWYAPKAWVMVAVRLFLGRGR